MEALAKRLSKYVAQMRDRLTCSICEMMLTDCRRVTCGHWFCADCIEQHIKDKPKNARAQCPTCNKNITKASLKEDDQIEDVIDILKNCLDILQDEGLDDDASASYEEDEVTDGDSEEADPALAEEVSITDAVQKDPLPIVVTDKCADTVLVPKPITTLTVEAARHNEKSDLEPPVRGPVVGQHEADDGAAVPVVAARNSQLRRIQ